MAFSLLILAKSPKFYYLYFVFLSAKWPFKNRVISCERLENRRIVEALRYETHTHNPQKTIGAEKAWTFGQAGSSVPSRHLAEHFRRSFLGRVIKKFAKLPPTPFSAPTKESSLSGFIRIVA